MKNFYSQLSFLQFYSFVLLSSVIGNFGMSDANDGISNYNQYGKIDYHVSSQEQQQQHHHRSDLLRSVEHAPKHQQKEDYWKEVEPFHNNSVRNRLNATLWAAVVEAALRTPFDWMELSKTLDRMEGRFSPVTSRNSQEYDEGLKNERNKSRGSRWKFTYHRVLTFLRSNSTPGQRKLSAIAAVSASEIRPSSPPSPSPPLPTRHSEFQPSTTKSVIRVHREGTPIPYTLEEEIISRLLLQEHHNEEYDYPSNEEEGEDFISSTSRRHFHPRKLRGHSHGSRKHPLLAALSHNHTDTFRLPIAHSQHPKRHDPMK